MVAILRNNAASKGQMLIHVQLVTFDSYLWRHSSEQSLCLSVSLTITPVYNLAEFPTQTKD